ncbi:MAG: glycosyltransferase family 4 protein [Anaerovoracaceae bacterium]|nr:glycosyltransferase family 4 protein [Anaerovoracaceae bacterium]
MTSVHDSFDTRVFQKECVSLAKEKDFEVYLVSQGESRVDKNVKVVGMGKKPKSRIKRLLCFTKEIYKAAREIDADIYHFHDPELLIYAKKLKKLNKIVIFDSHENTAEQINVKGYIPFFLRRIISKIYKTYEQNVCNKIDAVIYPCTESGTTPFDSCSARLLLINNFPIASTFVADESVEKIYDICCAGSLTEERGIIELLEASRIANAKLVLAGEFSPDSLKEKLEDRCLLDTVVFKGNCSLDEVKMLLNKSRMVVSNIHNIGQYYGTDNLPTKVYEAMAMKLPVILSTTDYNRMLTKKYGFGVCVDPQDVSSIARHIKNFMDNKELARRLGEKGRALIEKHFSWEKEEKKLVNIYRELENECNK